MVHHKHHHHYKPYKKQESTTKKIFRKVGEVAGYAKEGIVAGYKAAERAAPKVSRYTKVTRQEIAREVEPRYEEEQPQPIKRRYPTQEEINNLIRINKRLRMKRKPFREPFSRVTREQQPNTLELGWGGF